MGGVVSALAGSISPHRRRIQMQQQQQQQQQLCKDDNKKVVVQKNMGGGTLLLAIGRSSLILSSLLLLAPILLLFPPPPPHKKKQQQRQHNDDDDDNKLWRRRLMPHQYPFLRQQQQQQRIEQHKKIAGRIVSALVASFLSSSSVLAPNLLSQLLLSLLPHHHRRRIQQRNDNSRRQILKIVVVDQERGQPAKTCLLEIAQGEDTLYTINFGPRDTIPLATCHGMFLSITHQNPERLAIWNPTTSNNKKKKMMTTIPQSSVPRPPRVKREFVRSYGFGFDPSSNDYKVIRFIKFAFYEFDSSTMERNNNLLVELYSLKTNSWKQIPYPHGATGYGSDPVCVYTSDGFCYCRTNDDDHLLFIPFDLANDSFPPALIPGPPDTRRSSFAPVEFEGSLAVFAYQYRPFELELWVWNKNNESWSLRGEWANIGDPAIGYSPRGRFFNNGVVFLQNHCVVGHELVLFDCANQTLKLLGVYDDPFLYVFPYN